MAEEHTAGTYSLTDNKLRIYPAEPKYNTDTLQKLKLTGYRWAPHQKCFVSPAWTPERETLALELCGEIIPEEKDLQERQEERASRAKNYSEIAETAALALEDASGLVGDEDLLIPCDNSKIATATRRAKKIDNTLKKINNAWDKADYWQGRAVAALRYAKYKESPNVRARRIENLKKGKRKAEREIADCKHRHFLWRQVSSQHTVCITSGALPTIYYDKTERRSLWSMVTAVENPLPWEEARAIAIAYYDEELVRQERWRQHYDNRIIYEESMLQAQGGAIVNGLALANADLVFEVGGAVKTVMDSGNYWSLVRKVYAKSVSVYSRYAVGNLRLIRIEKQKIKKALSAEKVNELLKEKNAELSSNNIVIFADVPEEPSLKAYLPPAAPSNKRTVAAKVRADVITSTDLYVTPPEVMVRILRQTAVRHKVFIPEKFNVLEPSAGTGCLLSALHTFLEIENWKTHKPSITAVDISDDLCLKLAAKYPGHKIYCHDFLTWATVQTYDLILMNPPFSVKSAGEKHIEKALKLLTPKTGLLLTVFPDSPAWQKKLRKIAGSTHEIYTTTLLADTFKDAGTNVATAVATFYRTQPPEA